MSNLKVPGRQIPGKVNMWLISEQELGQLRQNGIDRVLLTELPGGLENEIFQPPLFNMPCLALNYLYRPTDENALQNNPHLRFLPSLEESKAQ
jgi:hypothetical protein